MWGSLESLGLPSFFPSRQQASVVLRQDLAPLKNNWYLFNYGMRTVICEAKKTNGKLKVHCHNQYISRDAVLLK
jgi:hypothetical protein